MTYKWFSLNVLYHIKNKQGKQVLFTPNEEKEERFLNHHGRELILKARQLGFTTFEMIDSLDECLFIPDFNAGCICYKLDSSKDLFMNKITFAYNSKTDDQKAILADIDDKLPRTTSDKGNAYVFDNGSAIKVSTS